MKKKINYIIFILLFSVILSLNVFNISAYQIDIDFSNSAFLNVSYDLLPTQPNDYGILNNSCYTVINNFGETDLLPEFCLIDFRHSNNSNVVLDNGNIIFHGNLSGLEFYQNSYTSGTGSTNFAIYLKFNQNFRTTNLTEVKFLITIPASNERIGMILYKDKVFVEEYFNSLGSVTNYVQNYTITDNQVFNEILFYHRDPNHFGFGNINIFSLNITNLLNIETNILPTFNVTQDILTICLENEIDIVNFNFTINVNDEENDTILYATQLLKDKNFNKSISFNSISCGFFGFGCSNIPDPSFLENTYFNTSDCKISIDNLNLSNHNVLEFNNKYMLMYNGACSGISKSFTYKLPESLTEIWYYTEINNLIDTNEEFIFSFFDSTFTTEILRFKVNNTLNNQYIYNFNGTDYNFQGNFSEKNNLQFSLNSFLNLSNNILIVFGCTSSTCEGGGIYNITTLNTELDVKYIKIKVKNGTTMFQDDFIFSGFNIVPDFSTSKPNNITLQGQGFHQLLIFVTDNVHENIDFVRKKVNFKVQSNLYCYGNNNVVDNTRDCFYFLGSNPSIFQRFLFLMQFPYGLLCIFGLIALALPVGAILILLITFKDLISGTFELSQYLFKIFAISTILMTMKFFSIPIYIVIVLILGLILGKQLIGGGE